MFGGRLASTARAGAPPLYAPQNLDGYGRAAEDFVRQVKKFTGHAGLVIV
jgi:hypothetical protein